MRVIGLCGKAGAGKGTVAEMMREYYTERLSRGESAVFPLAYELKRIAKQCFDWDGQKDKKGRRLLQVLGTEAGRMYGGDNFWVEKWHHQVIHWERNHINISTDNIDFQPLVICDDVRFDNEAEYMKENLNATIYHITGRAYELGENSTHPSELGVDHSLIDYTICNSGTMEELRTSIEIIVRGWK